MLQILWAAAFKHETIQTMHPTSRHGNTRFIFGVNLRSLILVLMAWSIVCLVPAYAHPGGVNSSGCHSGSEQYHCHADSSADEELRPKVRSGVITHVRDGDTIIMGRTPVRLAAVDCPEKGSRKGDLAKLYMEKHIGRRVTCEFTGAETFDRKVAYCRIGSADLGRLLFFNTSCKVWERFDVWGRYTR